MIALRRSPIAPALSWIAALAFVAAFAIAAGCGGSGSSGFDLAESAAIDRVTSDQECEDFDGLLICPADSPPLLSTPTAPPDPTASMPTIAPTHSATPEQSVAPQATPTPPASTTVTGTPTDGTSPTPAPATATATAAASATPSATPSPTAIASPAVFTQIGEANDVQTCEDSNGVTCTVRFSFSPVGFSSEAAFRVASRRVGVETPWRIDNPTPAGVAGAPFVYVAPLEVDLTEPAAGSPSQQSLQVVVLAFERDPGPVPESVALLADTGADVAFAVAPFDILVE